MFSCTERITPLEEEEEIGIKTIGKVTRITTTNAKMVRYMVFDISKILYFTLDLSSLFEGAELVLIHTLVELLLWIH